MKVSILNTNLSHLLTLLLLSSPLNAAPNPDKGKDNGGKPGGPKDKPFTYESLKATTDLRFTPCYGKFQCALLQVPLEYARTTPDGETASIAVIKYESDPTEFPEYSDKWAGPIMFNPGGPGGSGVEFLLGVAEDLSQVLGRQFSLVSFDPRGVNNSTPMVSCFDSPLDRQVWALKAPAIPGATESGMEIGEAYVRAKMHSEICRRGKRAETYSHLGTASTATDMLKISEGMWDLAEKKGRKQPRKGLQYWGFSYGTLLGTTFAKMYPDKVETMVLDGVLDAKDYYTGTFERNLIDAEDAVTAFFEYCFLAGPVLCKFHTGTSPDDIRARWKALVASIREEPRPYFATEGDTQPSLITWSDLTGLLFRSLYSPLVFFPLLADFLTALDMNIHVGSFLRDMNFKTTLTCPATENDPANIALRNQEATTAIICLDVARAGDGPNDVRNWTLAEAKARFEDLQEQSPSIAGVWFALMLQCMGWKAKPDYYLDIDALEPKANETWPGKNPILLVGNTADPVTPLDNAFSVADLFPKGAARVATQIGPGHCTVAAPSACMYGLINQYFATGTLPEGELVCQMEVTPFFPQEPAGNMTTRRDIQRRAVTAYAKIGEAVAKQVAHGL